MTSPAASRIRSVRSALIRTFLLGLVILFAGAGDVHARLGSWGDTEMVHEWFFTSGSHWYGFTAARKSYSPETTYTRIHLGPAGRYGFLHPSSIPVLPLAAFGVSAVLILLAAYGLRSSFGGEIAEDSTESDAE
ncbi:MAG: hypothetical protein ACI9OD_001556 [Limisphaerales bacterium]|jgi:hypothetical protein